ncbi:MAG: DNA internalization-related competence protein ComEC/Rec2 [Halanaerobiales bacterium]
MGGDYFRQYPFFWIAVFLAAGIMTGYFAPGFFGKLLVLNILFIVIYYLGVNNFISFKVIFILLLVFLTGLGLITEKENRYNAPDSVKHRNDKGKVSIQGEMKLDLKSLQGENIYLDPLNDEGLILLKQKEVSRNFKNGELVTGEIELETPPEQKNPGGFCYQTYLKQQGIYSLGQVRGQLTSTGRKNYLIKNNIIRLKKKLLYVLEKSLAEPYIYVMEALLLGERDRLPEEWEKSFSQAGANHLLAISGLHVGFLILILVYFFKLVGCANLYRNLLLTFFMICYIIITGGRASVFRAGLLSVLFLWAPFFDRQGNIFNILGFTAFLNLLVEPYVLFSPGFQLTYLVVIAIVLWTGIFNKFMPDIIAVSLAAQLGSIPLTAYYFNQLTPVGILTNIWAIPLSGLVVGTGFMLLIIGSLSPVMAAVPAFLLQIVLDIFSFLMNITSRLPFAYLEVSSPPVYLVFVIYGYIIFLPFLLSPRIIPVNKRKKQKRLIYFAGFAVALTLFLVCSSFFSPALEVIFFDVGQGDSILLNTPGQHHILVDGGGQVNRDSDMGEQVLLPYFKQQGIYSLDLVFVTHFHDDHAAGIKSILRKRKVEVLVLPQGAGDNELGREIIRLAREKGTEVLSAHREDYFRAGEVLFEVLHPDKDNSLDQNNNSLVLKIIYDRISFLFTGDLEKEGEKELLQEEPDLKSQVLKVGHHGAGSSSSHEFLQAVAPREAVISVGENNFFGHPDSKVLDKIKNYGINTWRTDRQGAIIIKTRGQNYRIKSYLSK